MDQGRSPGNTVQQSLVRLQGRCYEERGGRIRSQNMMHAKSQPREHLAHLLEVTEREDTART